MNINNKIFIPLIDNGNPFKSMTETMKYVGYSMKQYPSGCIMALKKVKDYDLLVPGDDYVIEVNGQQCMPCQIQMIKPGYITAYSTNIETYPDGQLMYPPLDIPIFSIKHIYRVLGYLTD